MKLKLFAVAAFAAATAASSAGAAGLYFSIDSSSALYQLDLSTAAPTLVGTTGVSGNTVGLSESNDPNILYGSTWNDLATIDISSGTHTIIGSISGGAEGLAWAPDTQTLYGYINRSFFTLDPSTANRLTTLATTPAEVEGLAWRGDSIYGFGGTDDTLYRYSIAGDSWSTVGSTSIPFADSTGLAYDPSVDLFYAINDAGGLYSVNPNTAASTFIGDTGLGRGGGLAFVGVPEPSVLGLLAAASSVATPLRRRR
ncbi:hypothetical protein Pla123a_18450 [Posidoniimonas polymericola]|uniref:PEP-CTERM protein-sorting domain-containing protein n=1 Tax=Posidoniimonas polymericola TaxID=2528002 RepID=A0A5C5YR10_9BACT|nr:hypothetical protein [Posidoniimonas polymericola]TWT77190.1 hypothetical protein Pla123a_18450 [Posidoniimonas polymericola]